MSYVFTKIYLSARNVSVTNKLLPVEAERPALVDSIHWGGCQASLFSCHRLSALRVQMAHEGKQPG